MTDKLTLAVNHALNDARMARARMGMLAPTMGLDNKRSSAWCEYGFPELVTYDNLYSLYRRGGIAHGAVEKLVGKCWQSNPEIIEGDDDDESKDETAWETKSKQVFTNRFWRAFAEADRRRLVGRYAGLLLHVRDDKDWNLPVVKGRGLQKVTVAWAGSLAVGEWDTGLNSKTYGQPKMWQYTERLPNGSTRRVNIHPDRVFILGDYSDDAIGFLEPAYTSDADDGGGYVETIITNSDFTLSFEGEVRKKDKLDQYGVGKFIKYFADELKAKRQPGIWVRMDYGPVEFVGYMNITALSSDGGTNDIVTFSTEFKVGDATTIEVNELTAVAVTGVTVTPATSTGTAGGTSTFTVNIAPTGATNKDFTVATTDATKATATASGNTVTVTRVATGSAQIIINTEDGNFVAVHTVTVT